MRDQIIRMLTDAGFQHVDTNRWGRHGKLDIVFRIGYASNEWTVSYKKNNESEVRRWRLTTDSIPQDLLVLIAEWIDVFRVEQGHLKT
jgi:hypothetical protein